MQLITMRALGVDCTVCIKCFTYYAGIMLDAFLYLLCLKLCRHSWLRPSINRFPFCVTYWAYKVHSYVIPGRFHMELDAILVLILRIIILFIKILTKWAVFAVSYMYDVWHTCRAC